MTYGPALQYVKEQTPELCLEAVKRDGWALKFVKEQTDEICLAAVKEDAWALEFVKNKTPEIYLAALIGNPEVIVLITDYDILNTIRKIHPKLIAKLYDRP